MCQLQHEARLTVKSSSDARCKIRHMRVPNPHRLGSSLHSWCPGPRLKRRPAHIQLRSRCVPCAPVAMESPFKKALPAARGPNHGFPAGVKTTPVNASPVPPGCQDSAMPVPPATSSVMCTRHRPLVAQCSACGCCRMSWAGRGRCPRAAQRGTSARCSAACGGRCRACSRWAT